MQFFTNEHIFNFPWDQVSTANWIKYPNQITPHVTNIDYLSRHLDPETGYIHTERLITCRQSAPDFFVKLMGGHNTSMVLEHSIVDPKEQKLVLKSRNITLSHIMTVEETCTYEPVPGKVDQTRFIQEAKITAWSGWSYIREALEDFSVSRFQANGAKGRAALEQVLQDFRKSPKQLLLQKFGDAARFLDEESLKMAQEGILEPE